MLEEVYGKAAMKETQVCDWHKRFLDGRASVSDDWRCGRPTPSTNNENNEGVSNVVRNDRRKSS
jgi:hypothetical protein